MPLSPYKQAIARLYDARARSYDHAGENTAWHLRLCDTLLRRAAVQVDDRVLDLATGTGTIAHWHSLLRPGGWLHLQTHSADAFVVSGMLADVARERGIELSFHTPFGSPGKLEGLLAAAGFEAIDILEESDHVEVLLSQILRSVPQRNFPFPGQEHLPLQDVGEEAWASIHGETLSRLERIAENGVILDIRTSLFASARRPAWA